MLDYWHTAYKFTSHLTAVLYGVCNTKRSLANKLGCCLYQRILYLKLVFDTNMQPNGKYGNKITHSNYSKTDDFSLCSSCQSLTKILPVTKPTETLALLAQWPSKLTERCYLQHTSHIPNSVAVVSHLCEWSAMKHKFVSMSNFSACHRCGAWQSGPNNTRRPASADRTARAANFRRDLEAT